MDTTTGFYGLDHAFVARLREQGYTWNMVAEIISGDYTGNAVRKAHKRWEKRTLDAKKVSETQFSPESDFLVQENDVEGRVIQKWVKLEDGSTVHVKMDDGVKESDAREAFEAFKQDALIHVPSYDIVERADLFTEDGILFELAIHDPHFGMLAYHREVGGTSQDLATITEDYGRAVDHLLTFARIYNTERILYVVGHDMQHVNQTGQNNSGGTTAKGTAQDVDGRLSKIFTTIRRAAVRGIDAARLIAPVDVVVVPGNHDPDEMYKLGEVLNAWYRTDPEVDIQYGANKRKFYNYGANTFMFDHGEAYGRKRDSLPLIMADECPADWWVASAEGCREIHTGHNHRLMQGGYYPDAEVTESRGIRTRSLPGLTATDAWHHESGYKHQRSATALIYRRSGGFEGLHEFQL